MRGATGISSAHRRLTRFQSTPLMRGATRWARPTSTSPACFNPRPSCEGRLDPKAGEYARLRVSIHAPHARGDDELLDVVVRDVVSIHAPHARGDSTLMVPSSLTLSFNPRPSCEGRPRTLRCRRGRYSFQSTPLMRGATCVARADRGPRVVSIHAPHARGDPCATPTCPGRARFNPRPSCEGRQLDVAKLSTSHTRYSTGFYKVSLRNPLLCNCHGAIEPKKCEPYVSLMTA